MKKILIKLIKLYQAAPLLSHYKCRFYPTCSNYAIEALETHGTFNGSFLAIRRILRCHPFGKSGVDLVPPKKIKNH